MNGNFAPHNPSETPNRASRRSRKAPKRPRPYKFCVPLEGNSYRRSWGLAAYFLGLSGLITPV
jgi:hypothetical protein